MVGIPVRETVPQPLTLRVREVDRVKLPVTDLVKGWVVGMPVRETVILVERVGNLEGSIVIAGVIDRVIVTERVYEEDTVTLRVKGWVVGIPVRETVTQPVTLRVIDTERVKVPVTLRVKGWVVAIPVLLTVPHRVTLTVADTERVIVTDTVRVGEAAGEAERVIVPVMLRVPLPE